MSEKESKSVIAGYLQMLDELIGSEDSEGNYAYRGQKNADWDVESGALRRIEETNPQAKKTTPSKEKEDFISYHEKELLEPARMDGYGDGDGRPLYDLELLAKLQHHGAATCLIDFTRNFLVAMWFACQPHKEKDGKIFILKTSDEKNLLSLEEKDLEKKVRSILTFQTRDEDSSSKETTILSLPKPSWWHWSPQGLDQRILKQESLFVFGQTKIKKMLLQWIKIKNKHKKKILKELDRLGITERTLFKDLPGFAESHGRNKPLPLGYGKAEYYLQKGNEALQRDDFKGAMADYNEAIKINSDYAEAYNNRGDVKYNLDDLNGAIADYARAIKYKHDFAEAYKNRGIVKADLGDHRGAIADYSRAIKYRHDFAEAYNNRGIVKADLDDHRGAIADYSKAIKFDPDDAVAYYNRGIAKSDSDDHRGAIADFNRAIKIDPDDARAYNYRGIVNRRLGRYSKAIANYNRAIEIDPDFAVAYYNRGIVNRRLGRYSKTIADYNRAVELNPDYANAYYNRGNVNRRLGHHSDAIADYDWVIELEPGNAKAYYNRGRAYASLGDKKKARRDYLKAKKLAKRSGDKRLLGLIDKALSKLDNGNNNKS